MMANGAYWERVIFALAKPKSLDFSSKHVIFTDEQKFNYSELNGLAYYWQNLRRFPEEVEWASVTEMLSCLRSNLFEWSYGLNEIIKNICEFAPILSKYLSQW